MLSFDMVDEKQLIGSDGMVFCTNSWPPT